MNEPNLRPPTPGLLLSRTRFKLYPLRLIERRGRFEDRTPVRSPDWGFWYILEGRGQMTVGRQTLSLAKGSLAIFRPGDAVLGKVGHGKGAQFYSMQWMPIEFHMLEALVIPQLVSDPRGALGPVFQAMHRAEVENTRDLGGVLTLKREQFLYDVFIHLIQQNHITLHGSYGRSPDYQSLLAMMDHLSGAIHRPFSLAELAGRFALDPTTVTRRFRRHLGTTPASWFRDKRLEESRGLVESGLGVAEVARRCGFPDPFTFSKAFKRRYQRAPSEYLKELRQKMNSGPNV